MDTENEAKVVVTKTMILAGPAVTLARVRVDCQRYPTTEEGLRVLLVPPDDEFTRACWRGPSVADADALKDAWGRDLSYTCPGRHNPRSYDLSSPGPDGEPGTSADIRNW